MITQRSGQADSHLDLIGLNDESQRTKDACQANIYSESSPPNSYGYEACGERLRKRNNGSTYCPEHGPMH